MFRATFVMTQSSGYQHVETSLDEVDDQMLGVSTSRQLTVSGVFKTKESEEIMLQHLLKKHQAEAEANLHAVKSAAKQERERKKRESKEMEIANLLCTEC